MLERFVRHIQGHKKFHLTWIITLTIITTLFITGVKIGDRQIIRGLRIDNSLETYFKEDDPVWISYKKFQEKFEGDEIIIIAFSNDKIFSPEVLSKIKNLTEKLNDLPYVSRIVSLTNIDDFRAENGGLVISEMFKTIPGDVLKLNEIRERVLKSPLYTGNVISSDGRTAAIIIRVKKQPSGIDYQRQLTDLVFSICEKESDGGKYNFHIAGSPILMGFEDKATNDDAVKEYILLFIMLVVFLYFIYHRVVYVVIPLAVIGIAIIWIYGIINMCGSSFNMTTNFITVLVMVIGIADTIHFVSEYDRDVKNGKKNTDAAREACILLFRPLFFACFTTVVGFMSMGTSSLKGIRGFGIFSGIAISFTFIVNVVLVTMWLGSLKEKRHAPGKIRKEGFGQRIVRWIAEFNNKHVKVNVAVAVILFLVSISGLVRIQINTHDIKYFKEDHPIRVATEFIEKNLTGTIPLEIILTGKEDAFRDPAILEQIDELQRYIRSIKNIRKSFSVADYLKEMNKVIHDDDQGQYKIPDSANAVSQLLLLTEGENNEIEQYIDLSNFKTARIHSRLNYVTTNEMQAVFDSIDKKAKEIFNTDDIKAEITGLVPMYLHASSYIIDSQIYSFGTAFIVIGLVLTILVRSIKLGLIAMIPNIIPVFLTFGIMGWLNIYLDLGTVLISSVAIGLGDDNTIHFITRFRHFFDKNKNYNEAVNNTFHSAGLEIIDSSIVLFFGFGILTISTFKPVVNFGLLSAVTMLSAIVANLFVTPALIKIFKPFGPEIIPAPGETAEVLSD